MRIFLLGASGFVGSTVFSHLTDLGHEVIRAVGPSRTGHSENISLDVSEYGSFPAIEKVGKLDSVVNCAGIAHRFGAISSHEFARVNVEGARNVARFAKESGATTLVHISSVSVYGPIPARDFVEENADPAPIDLYSRSKLDGEIAVAEICVGSGTTLVILRPAPIIGEGSRGNVSRLIRAIDRRRFLWVGDGSNIKSLVYVGDVARAVALAIESEGTKSVFNVVGDSLRMADIVSIIADQLQVEIPRLRVPSYIAALCLRALSGTSLVPALDRPHRILSTWLGDGVFSGVAFRNHYGFIPATSIEEGLRRQVDDYLQDK